MKIILFLLFFCSSAFAANITLAWDASETPNVEYKIYYGTKTGVYTQSVEAGPGLKARLINLPAGTYFFVVVAVKDGEESEPTNEIQATLTEVQGIPNKRRPLVP